MKILFLSLISIFSIHTVSANSNSCRLVFEKSDIEKTIKGLAELRLNLDFAIVANDQSLTTSALLKAFQKEKDDFLQYLVKNKIMDAKELNEKIKQHIGLMQKEKEKEQESRHRERKLIEQEVKSSIDGSKAVFFKTNNDTEMMATPVTQIIWKKIVQLAKAKLPSTSLDQEDPSYFKGDLLPVENVAPWLVKRWVDSLNLLSKNNEPGLYEIISGHQPGDTYLLPTRHHWFSIFEKFPPDYLLDYITANRLGKNAWLQPNSAETTHPVAQKAPLMLEGTKPFYDLIGNVFEITGDVGADSSAEVFHYVIGGSYKTPANDIKKLSKHLDYDEQAKDTGFRLIRLSGAKGIRP